MPASRAIGRRIATVRCTGRRNRRAALSRCQGSLPADFRTNAEASFTGRPSCPGHAGAGDEPGPRERRSRGDAPSRAEAGPAGRSRAAAGPPANGPLRSARAAKKNTPKKIGQGLRPWTPGGKDVRTQGVSVRATRKPRRLVRAPGELKRRRAERKNTGLLRQEPPRITRRPQFPDVHALPSDGAPA